ncbi:hypothetical protein H7F50_13840 [Novosphingobium flavum]|uniref:phage tail protein n=1 Tax=Novosphingobium aerophilum TaxID=2839843 RepID=UPI00163AC703|nr:hypothetical protein [Novosphingobium aerophilum]MBC2662835.1 hypothetical protein [Novosphingobium aerophilum]
MNPVLGSFEFFYVAEPAGWVACVEWQPGIALSGSDSPPVGELDMCYAACKTGEPFCVRLAEPLSGEKKPLTIGGAMVFDQYVPQSGKLDLRLLLARDFEQATKNGFQTYQSAVVLGDVDQDKKPCFGFVLALPTPGPQAHIDGKTSHVFPFRAQFLSTRPALPDDATVAPIDWIAAGVAGAKSDCDHVKLSDTVIADARLGRFGFTYKNGGVAHLQFPRRNGKGDKDALWLLNGREAIYKTGTLDRFAKLDGKFHKCISLANLDDERKLSIWIGPQKGGSRIVFRSSFRRSIAATPAAGDFQTSDDDTHNAFTMLEPFGGEILISPDTNRNRLDIAIIYHFGDDEIAAMLTAGTALEGEIEVAVMVQPGKQVADCIDAMNELRAPLMFANASEPINLLPDLKATSTKVPFALAARIAFRLEAGRIVWRNQPSGNANWPKAPFGLQPWRGDDERGLEKPVYLTATFKLPGLVETPDIFTATLGDDDTPVDPDAPGMVRFGLTITKSPALKAQIGALELAVEANQSAGGHWRFRPGGDNGIESLEFAIEDLPLLAVTPVRTDVRRGDRSGRERPLLLASKSQTVAEARFLLSIDERLSGRDDRRLTAIIKDVGKGSAPEASYVILSHEPFAVVQVRSILLEGRGDSANQDVAFWDSDTRQWQFKLAGRTYHYRLPPQAVGESMDKPRRLEIVDPKAGDPAAPYPDNGFSYEGIPQRHAVEYRLSPPADLWLDPVDVERSYYLPEWESYDIFRQRGELGIGAALSGFRGEFLYGMPVSVDPSRENGAARATRVAEIETLLGRPPGRLKAGAADTGKNRWNSIVRAMAHRPERLEFWMREPGSTQPFVPARFSGGVRHALRSSARFRAPLQGLEGEPGLFEFGLCGGAIWPVEQRAFVKALLDRPLSTGGSLERIALSPHGGDADSRAEFLDGLVAIIAETRSGRVQRQRVEITGRIGVFWHRAKHVVIYERTVNPSAQFTPLGGIGARTRRPVLRKVEEFVELIEPERRYPDNPLANAASAGFLHAVRFNSRRIHVDSEWSEDVDASGKSEGGAEKTGWRIPLWNRHSAEQRPSVYPRPDIAFVTHAEGDGDVPLAAQECLDPDNLYFFADARPPFPDTDRWPAVLGVDWINLPPPTAGQQPNLDGERGGEGQRLPSAPRFPRGHRRFTWRLAPPSQRTALNAGRSGKPLFAGLETLTFSRAGHAADSAVATKLAEEIATIGKILDPNLEKTKQALSEFQSAIRSREPDRIKASAKALESALKADSTWATRIKPSGFYKFPENPGKQCEKLVGEFAASFERRRLLYLAQLRAWADDGKAVIATPVSDYQELIDDLTARAMEALEPAVSGVQHDIGRVEQDLARARTMIGDFEAENARVLGEARRKLAELRDTYDSDKPWSPHRVEEHHIRIAAIRDGIAGDIETAASEIRLRLATELGQIGHAIGVALAAVVEHAARGEAAIVAGIGESAEVARAVLAAIAADTAAALHLVDQALERTAGDGGATEAEKVLLEVVKKSYDGLAAQVGLELTSLSDDIATGAATLDGMIAGAAAQLTAIEDKIEAFAGGAETKLAQITSETLAAPIARLRKVIAALVGAARRLTAQAAVAAGGLRRGIALADNAAQALVSALRERINAFGEQLVTRIETALAAAEASEADKDALRTARSEVHAFRRKAAAWFDQADIEIRQGRKTLTVLVTGAHELFREIVTDFGKSSQNVSDELAKIVDQAMQAHVAAITSALRALANSVGGLVDSAAEWGATPDLFVARLEAQIAGALTKVDGFRKDAFKLVNEAHRTLSDKIKGLKEAVGNEPIKALVKEAVIKPALARAITEPEFERIKNDLDAIRALVVEAIDTMVQRFDEIANHAGPEFAAIQAEAEKACKAIESGIDQIKDAVDKQIDAIKESFKDRLGKLSPIVDDAAALLQLGKEFENDVAKISADFSAARVAAEAYADRVIDAAGNITEGGLASAPNNLLRLYAAAASAPALPNLDFARERLGYYYGQLQSVIDTTQVDAWFGRLGDELKALGLSLPFNKISEAIVPDDLSNFDIGRVFRNFGGVDLSNLFQGIRLPKGAGDAVRVTHDFDRKALRAWVQVDINLSLPGRKQLFALGPFNLDFVDSVLVATVRLECSKDTDAVEQSGRAALTTNVDAVVSGQSMVTIEKLVVNFARGGGLKVDLDPRQIKLNPSFKFIQETLGKLFASDDEDAGGLKLVKHNGIPVGVEHVFAIPPFDAMAGTSGVSNIAISNRFSLLAFPDFVIANRFALSRPDRPFLFSIFILGGTGYLTVDCEYRPFTRELTVEVDAAAGGSAALGFSLGPVRGSVQVTLSIALTYRKQIGKPGGGLSASMVLVIAGRVDVAGIASVDLTLMLRMAYHENGRIDGVGTMSVSVRISRFYTFRVRRDAKYKLRDGGGGGGHSRSLAAPMAVAPAPTPRERAKQILEARG